MYALLAYAHSLSMIALGAMLFTLLLAFDRLQSPAEVRRFVRFSLWTAVAAVVMLLSGAAMVAGSPLDAAFYFHNPVFYIKLALFTAMLLVGITPARIILFWHRGLASDAVPDPVLIALVRRYVTVELVLFLLVPLAAALTAQGIGLQASSS